MSGARRKAVAMLVSGPRGQRVIVPEGWARSVSIKKELGSLSKVIDDDIERRLGQGIRHRDADRIAREIERADLDVEKKRIAEEEFHVHTPIARVFVLAFAQGERFGFAGPIHDHRCFPEAGGAEDLAHYFRTTLAQSFVVGGTAAHIGVALQRDARHARDIGTITKRT